MRECLGLLFHGQRKILNLWHIEPSPGALERMKMLHMLVAHGAKWLPADKHTIADARRNLLKMAPAYALEFAWLMQTYRAARRKDMEELFRTPAIARLLARDRDRLSQIVAGVPEEPLGGEKTSLEKGAR